MNWEHHFASRMTRMHASEIREMLKLLNQPDIISFAGGIPDAKLFPVGKIADVTHQILSDPKRASAALQYSVSEGYQPLRVWLADYMGKRGLPCSADNVIITNGSQQALDFLGKLFISPGDKVLTSSPTYLGAVQAFNAYEPCYDTLPLKGEARTSESYKTTDGRLPKFGYVMPEFQNPTGDSLTLDERNALLDFANAMDLPLVEDNAYEYLRYDGEPLPSIISLAAARAGGIDAAKVIHCGTFSKSIVPALRIGWIIAPKQIIEKLVLINQACNLHVSPFTQMIMYEVASQIIEGHTQHVCKIYKERRDAMLHALKKYMPSTVRWTSPHGGMFVWVTLPEHIDGAALLKEAIQEARVAFIPGAAFHPDRSGRNTVRLCYSLNEPETIDEGIRRLAGLLARF